MTKQPDGEAVKAELLGTTVPIHATGKHVVDPARLQEALGKSDSAIRLFCTGCGQYYELSAEDALPLIPEDDVWPEDLEGKFLNAASCSQCDGSDPTVVLVPIRHLLG
ncbi:hypothetical protein KJ733_01345 [Patescibacteria group bacterium]|nr:hypothetical protein [Patescibacteria group bacterium]